MKMKKNIAICWLRRDLRLDDNAALYHALKKHKNVLVLFVFDSQILSKLSDKTDARVSFLHQEISSLAETLQSKYDSSMLVRVGSPVEVWQALLTEYNIETVYTNHDFESYAIARDNSVSKLLSEHSIPFHMFKDHVVFEKSEVVKDDGLPYTVFTPYSKKWRAKLSPFYYKSYPTLDYAHHFLRTTPFGIPSLNELGFESTSIELPARIVKAEVINKYTEQRDIPSVLGTSRLGLHLRFGTLSIRKLLAYSLDKNQTFVNELIWRDFYQQILFHFPHVEKSAFRPQYDQIQWENNESHFNAWCEGKTGYPLVDAGMRELNATGFMHNRVRMLVASFLTKHLLIDWRWGEVYFAEKLLDFDLAANNGGWQWAAGCGTDAAPYFRIFSPMAQQAKFDPQNLYIKKWVPEFGTHEYPLPIVDHDIARKRCLARYQAALKPNQ